jgi:MtaA/CmuA family methyltransferase
MSDIAPQERLQRVLSGKPVDRPPVICPGGMMNAAVVESMDDQATSLPAAHASAEGMSILAERVRALTGFENLGVPFCMTVEPEVFGSEIDLGSRSCEPKIAREAFDSCDRVEIRDVGRLVQQGRIGEVIQAAHCLKRRNADVPVVASISGPISTAASVVSPLAFLKELRTNAQGAHRVLDYVTRLLIEYAREVAAHGADAITIGDPTATSEILGPNAFRTYAVHYLNRLCDAVHASGTPVIVHICGNMTRSREQLAQLHADAISTDAMIDLRLLKADFPGITTMGNLSTSLLEFGDSDKVSRNTERLLRDGIDIISPACGLSTSTRLDNIRALTGTVQQTRAS